MTKQTERRGLRWSFLSSCSLSVSIFILVTLLASGIFAALAAPCFADDGPKPDPSGIATGDKNSAVDAAGNPFVVSEPTDKSAPDYAAKQEGLRRLSGSGGERAAGGETRR